MFTKWLLTKAAWSLAIGVQKRLTELFSLPQPYTHTHTHTYLLTHTHTYTGTLTHVHAGTNPHILISIFPNYDPFF